MVAIMTFNIFAPFFLQSLYATYVNDFWIQWDFEINNDAVSTNIYGVTLNMNLTWVVNMRFWNTPAERDSAIWESYAAAKSWELPGMEWVKTVYAEFENASGDTLYVEDDIIYDLSLALWLDAKDDSTITASSWNVSQWDDKSWNDYHAIQSNVANQATELTDEIDFNGSSDYFYLDNINYQNTNPLDGIFVCTVFSTTVTNTGWNWAFLDFDRSEWFNFYNRWPNVWFSYDSDGTIRDITTAWFPINDWNLHVSCASYDNTQTTDTIVTINGNTAYSADLEPIWAQVWVWQATRYGFVWDGSEAATENAWRNNIYLDASINEIIHFDVPLSPQNREDIECSLWEKWGITMAGCAVGQWSGILTQALNPVDEDPVASIDYSPETSTIGNVVATLTNESEPITITNNGGSTTYTFTENGTFLFEFIDATGNTGSTLADVDWIVNAPPTDITLSNDTVDENIAAGSTIGTFTTTDQNTGDTHTYSLVSGTWDNDNGAFTILWNTLTINASPDFETQSSYSIRVQTDDGNGGTYEEVFTININDLDEVPPVITLTGSDPVNVVLNASYSDAWATCSDDVDSSCSVTVWWATVDTTTLGSYVITYDAVDAAGNNAVQVTRTVNVVPGDIPVITRIGPGSITHEVLTTYTDAWATANDTEDGSITANIVTVNLVDDTTLWSYTVTYDVTDSSNNNAVQVTRTVNIVDTTPPIITLIWSSPINIVKNATYVDAWATANDNYDGNITADIVTVNSVDTTTLWTYTITYNVIDSSSNSAAQVTRTVNVIAGDNPVITLLGSTPETVEVNTSYTDAWATASDTEDGNITADIITVNPVDITTVGSYTVTYDVTDSSDNSAVQVTRTVNVLDTTAPVITLTGSDPVNLTQWDSYTDAWATCSDNYDTSCSVVVGWDTVDTTRVWTYVITYDAFDAAGNNAIQVTRMVNVWAAAILINEVEYDSPGSENGAEWFEIYNLTSWVVNIENWTITEKVGTSSSKTYTFPSLTIPAWGYIVVTNETSDFQWVYPGITPDLDLPGVSYFNLKNSPDDELELRDPLGNSIDYVAWENTWAGWGIEAEDRPICRLPVADSDSIADWSSDCIPTPQAVNQFNATPIDIILSNDNFDENNSANITVGTLTTTDTDSWDTHTYSLVSWTWDSDNGDFSISGNTLSFTPVADFETKNTYSIRIQTDDGNPFGTYEEVFTITINNVNLAPTDITLTSQDIDENNTVWDTVWVLGWVDDGEDTNTLTYALACTTPGADDASFNISGTSLNAAAIYDFESQNTYNICVRVSDGVLSYDENFIITINDLDEVPPVVVITPVTKLQNSSITDTTIQIIDDVAVNAADISIDAASTVTASALSCAQTSITQVDCTISIDSSGDLVISALDTSANSWSDTETNYIVDTIPPNIPNVSVDTTGPYDIDNPELTFSSLDNVGVDYYTVTYSADDGGTGTGILTTINPATSPVVLALDPDEWVVHTITVIVYDAAGNSSTTTISFPPIITINAPTTISNSSITDSTVTITTPSGNDITNIALSSLTTGASLGTCTWAWWDTTDPYANPVTCIINNISASWTLGISAEDSILWAEWFNFQSYIIDTVDPVITITAPTKIDNVAITDTTIVVTDDVGIDVSNVVISGLTTASYSAYSCLQTNPSRVDCTIQIDDDGDLTIDAIDLAGNSVDEAEINYIIDTNPPVLSLNGVNPETVEYLASYTDADAIFTDVEDGTGTILWVWSVNTGILGSYTLTYDYTDTAGNPATQITRTVNVVDTTPPVISLIGSDPETVEVNTSYTDAWATALDNYDGDITSSIVINNFVDITSVWSYAITYDVTDSNGNVATQVTRTVNIVDTTPPVITLNGSNQVTVPVWGTYSELWATATDNYDTLVPGDIVIDSSSVNTSVLGTYDVSYDVTDSNGNVATQVIREVIVEDTVPPVISLIGSDPINVEVNTSYTDAGATANDNYDGNITANISTSNSVDIITVGSYTVTYDVIDSSGNIATQIKRTVNVVDTTPPVITLIGSDPETVEVNTNYTDAGATANDNNDGNLTSSVVTVNWVDITTIGSYSVTYDVTDSNGNVATQVTRTVNVVDTTPPVISLIGSDPLTLVKNATYTEFGASCSDNYDMSCSVIIWGATVDTSTLWTYIVTYDITDANGNVANQVTRTVNIIAWDTPIITLTGSDPITVEVNTSYLDAGATASDTEDGNITSNIVTVNPVDITTIWTYAVTYNVSDSSDNTAIGVTRTVNVVDTTAPFINLTWPSSITLNVNDPYTEYGATCSDNYDTTCSTTIAGDTVDITTVWVYTVTYDVTDANGNVATQVTRTVNVVTWNTPIITLTGSDPITVEVSTSYLDAWATANDVEDGDISSSIITVNPVDITNIGSYTVTYDVTDFSGNNAIQVTRTVNVVDTTAPIISLLWNSIETVNLWDPYTDAGATCSDNYDLSCTPLVSNPVDVNTLWVYTVTYNVTDSNGNIAGQVTRTVNVVTWNPPVITLTGNSLETVNLWDPYTDVGATASDIEDGNITANIVTVNLVDVNTLWTYTVTYNVVDSNSNNAIQVTRTVNVVNTATDSDGDGLPDYIEIIIGTDPSLTDTDGDGTQDSDNDLDTISPITELQALNNGDGNNDGWLDAIQNDVSSIPNVRNNRFNTLESKDSSLSSCSQINSFASKQEANFSVQDDAYNYSLGLWDFEIACATPWATVEIQIYLDRVYNTNEWIYRKYDDINQIYTDISSIVTYTTEMVWTTPVTVINYSITDGWIYDEDGLVNGVIVDPSGPAVELWGGWWSVEYDRCDGNDTSWSIYDGTCGDESEINVEEDNQEIVEPEEETEIIGEQWEQDIETEFSIENSFETCPIISDIQNPLYSYRWEIYSDTALTIFESQIDKFSEIGIVDGYDDGSFKPFQEMTRTEFLKVALISHCYIYRELEGETLYRDVTWNTWQARVIQKAESLWMINGDIDPNGNSIFRPNDTISKAEAVKILMRLSFIQAEEISSTNYNDITVEWHKKYIENGEALGLFDAESDGYIFNPDSWVQRQNMVDLISRLIQLY